MIDLAVEWYSWRTRGIKEDRWEAYIFSTNFYVNTVSSPFRGQKLPQYDIQRISNTFSSLEEEVLGKRPEPPDGNLATRYRGHQAKIFVPQAPTDPRIYGLS